MTNQEMDMTPDYSRIPFLERLDLQKILIPKMIPDYNLKSDEDKHRLAFEWADPETQNYALKVSDIIDSTINKEIRDLILLHDYEKACELIIPMLHEEAHAHAA